MTFDELPAALQREEIADNLAGMCECCGLREYCTDELKADCTKEAKARAKYIGQCIGYAIARNGFFGIMAMRKDYVTDDDEIIKG